MSMLHVWVTWHTHLCSASTALGCVSRCSEHLGSLYPPPTMPLLCVTWLIHTCDMTHSYVWHDSFLRVTWLIHTCDMIHSHVWHDAPIKIDNNTQITLREEAGCEVAQYPQQTWHDAHICVPWLIHMCDIHEPIFFLLSSLTEGTRLKNIWISKFVWFSSTLFWVTGTPFTHVKTCLKFCDSRENVFDMYGDSSESMLEILAVEMI